jgi:hypothetical protein
MPDGRKDAGNPQEKRIGAMPTIRRMDGKTVPCAEMVKTYEREEPGRDDEDNGRRIFFSGARQTTSKTEPQSDGKPRLRA